MEASHSPSMKTESARVRGVPDGCLLLKSLPARGPHKLEFSWKAISLTMVDWTVGVYFPCNL